MGGEDCCTTQLIDTDGAFDVVGLEEFVKKVKLAECGLSYAVVSVMGPQSSGKSTLMNHLFGTNFREMDALKGRYQTTKGIWIAKCIGIDPCTIAMDLEGTDGRERGENEAFERQSALFALAISDVVLINMWCHDIGREQAANIPLLKTVFQVMMRLFSPRRTTLLFVIRDITKTPLKLLEPVLRDDIQKIWNSISKPQIHKDTTLSEFFHVEVTALVSYEEKEVQFKEQVAHLRQRFLHSIAPGGLAGDRRGVIPASAFCYSAQQIWKVIRDNKDLDLPAHKVMVATVRCEEIANKMLSRLTLDEGWLVLEEAAQFGQVQGFGKKLNSILEAYMSEYDTETMYFDEDVRIKKRQELERKAVHLVHPAFSVMLGHLHAKALDKFKNRFEQSLKKGKPFAISVHDCSKSCVLEFDQGCADATIQLADWDSSKVRKKLLRDIEVHASSVRNEKLSEVLADFKKRLSGMLAGPTESLFDVCGRDTWVAIRKLLKHETDLAVSEFTAVVSGFDLDQPTFNEMINILVGYARGVVEKKARDEAGRVLIRMKDRFSTVFSHDHDSMPRVWSGNEDIRAITKDAYASVLQLLSVMAVVRLEEGKSDDIESTLLHSLANGSDAPTMVTRSTEASTDLLASSSWKGVSRNDTLLTPVQCKSLWKQFTAETQYTIIQAISAQEAHQHSNNWLPPPWAIMAIIVLGFNEFMLLLRNPLYLVAIFAVYIISQALWVQYNISGIFRHGTLAGILIVFSKLLSTITNLLCGRVGRQRENSGHLTPVQAVRKVQVPSTKNNPTITFSS